MSGSINRKLWLIEKIHKLNKPNYPCPLCYEGILTFQDKWALVKESAATQKENPEFLSQYPDSSDYRFAGILDCSNTSCKETISLIGKSSYTYVQTDPYEEPNELQYYKPVKFYPALHIFYISTFCPVNIKTQIVKSFSHFFDDTAAAANAIRSSLEMIMNEQNVKKTLINKKGKREHILLHKRIELFGNNRPELKHYILATKWIGNAGSHLGNITREDLLDGYELLSHCLFELYDKPSRIKELKQKADEINKRKKPRSTKKK